MQVRTEWWSRYRFPLGIKGKQPYPLQTHHVSRLTCPSQSSLSSPSSHSPGIHHAWPLPHPGLQAAGTAGRHHPPSSCLCLRPQEEKKAVGHPSPWLTATTYQLYKLSCLKDWHNLARRSPERCCLDPRVLNTSPSDPHSSRAPSDIALHVPHPLPWHVSVWLGNVTLPGGHIPGTGSFPVGICPCWLHARRQSIF